ncbi:MAG TPA: hypothetical protein VMG08_10140 [Allosphingosinicella sp.]|nr:hypothetical protein [Allosphingosinicella sp.]
MARLRLLASLGLLCVTTACVHDAARTRWAKGSAPLDEDPRPTLSISSAAAEPPAAVRLRDLPERTGAAVAAALAARTNDLPQYLAALGEPIGARNALNQDRTRLPRVIAIDVSPSGFSATDRLMRTQVTMAPVNFRFVGYTLAQSEYQTIDLESVTSSATTSANLTLSPSLGNVIEGVEAGISTERSRESAYTNRQRFRDLSVSFTPERVTVTRDGAPGIDLYGVTLLKASVRPIDAGPTVTETFVTAYKVANEANGQDLPAGEASITLSQDRIWSAQPLMVCARLDYVVRDVTSGGEFVDEGLQVARERWGSSDVGLYTLVPEEEVEVARYALVHPSGFLLRIGAAGEARRFSFSNLRDATAFLAWLKRTQATQVGPRPLWVRNGQRLAGADNSEIRIQRLSGGGEPLEPDTVANLCRHLPPRG